MRALLIALVLWLAGGVGPYHVYVPFAAFDGRPVGPKKGIGLNVRDCYDVAVIGAGWLYDWGGYPLRCPGVDSVPMLWDEDVSGWPPESALSSAWLLGFNEPDLPGQADIAPDAAAVLWHDVVEVRYSHKLLVAPAPSHIHPDWIDQFRAAYVSRYGHPPRLNALAIHCYMTTDQCKALVRSYEARAVNWGILGGVWLTEFAFKGDIGVIGGFLDWLEAEPGVSRYAWFTNRSNGTEPWSYGWPVLIGGRDVLTEYGVLYASKGG